MWKHRRAVLSGGSAGKLGRRGLLYLLLFQVLLPLVAPVVDVFAVYGLVFLDPLRIAGLWLGLLALQAVLGAYAFRLDDERAGPLWTLPLQQFVCRQLMYLVVIQSVATALAGNRLRRQRMERHGTLAVPPPPAVPVPAPAPAAPRPLADSWIEEARAADPQGVPYLHGGLTPGLQGGYDAPPTYQGGIAEDPYPPGTGHGPYRGSGY